MKPSIVRPTVAAAALLAATLAAGSLAYAGSVIVRPLLTSPVRPLTAGAVHYDACGTPVKESIKAAGGTLKLPACGGTSGKVTYGKNTAQSGDSVTIESSTTNPSSTACGSASGETTLAYVLATGNGSGSISYQNTSKKSSLKNTAFPSNATFTLYAYAFGLEQFSEKLGSPKKGVLKFASPLNGQTIPLGVTLCFELDTP